MRQGKPRFRLHLVTLEPFLAVEDELFAPAATAVPVSRRVIIDSDLRNMHATKKVGIPRAKFDALKSPLTQEVIVQVLVNKKGKVVDVRPLQADQFSQFLGMSAARLWEFKPYLVQGQPTEFYTELEFSAN